MGWYPTKVGEIFLRDGIQDDQDGHISLGCESCDLLLLKFLLFQNILL